MNIGARIHERHTGESAQHEYARYIAEQIETRTAAHETEVAPIRDRIARLEAELAEKEQALRRDTGFRAWQLQDWFCCSPYWQEQRAARYRKSVRIGEVSVAVRTTKATVRIMDAAVFANNFPDLCIATLDATAVKGRFAVVELEATDQVTGEVTARLAVRDTETDELLPESLALAVPATDKVTVACGKLHLSANSEETPEEDE